MTAIHRQCLTIRNSYGRPVIIYIEPWGEELVLPKDGWFEIAAEGPSDGSLDLDLAPNCLILYGWSGSTLSIYEGGKVMLDCSVPAPTTPLNHQAQARAPVPHIFVDGEPNG